MTAQSIFARILTITVMVVVVAALMRLTASPAQPTPPATQINPIAAMASSWAGEVAFGAPYAALTPLADAASATTDARFDPSDDYWGLPRSEGVDTVAAYCSPCHSLAIVMQQRQDAEGWNYLLTWMVEKQGMAPPPEDARAEIATYLSREFGDQ